jgi:transcriptional regulator with GAF, ATPase, and Fis domain
MTDTALYRHATRIPLYVPARPPAGLRDCWVVNVSATGMVLVATSEGSAPKVGALLETEFALPRTDVRIQCEARVVWVDEAAQRGAGQLSMGLAFVTLPATARAFLSQHVAAYRPQVVLAFASAALRAWCDELGNDVVLHDAASVDELREVVSRGDVSAVIIFGEDEATALEAVEAVGPEARGGRRWGLQYRPGVIFCAKARAEVLLRLHNEGKLFASLEPGALAELALAVQQASQDHAVRSELRRATHELERRDSPVVATSRPAQEMEGFIATSAGMRKVVELIHLVARQRLPVLIAGETGTGKELLARAIHGLSNRSNAPFVVQDCGVLSESLLDSELFGHVKGAFTGAVSAHPGLFGVADRGTIFLDEIENTTPGLQAKLLRVIESGELRSVGSAQSRVVDVRVVAASNLNLLAEVNAGRFRADLYYRLTAFPIEVPPLRERREDIMPLAEMMLERAAASLSRRVEGFTPAAEAVLVAQEWRGNVRELRNIVERAALLTPDGEAISPTALPEWMTRRAGELRAEQSRSLGEQLMDLERRLVREALTRHDGVLRRAALELRINPMTLSRRAARLGLWPWPGAEPAPEPPPAHELAVPAPRSPRVATTGPRHRVPRAEPARRQKI